MNRSPDRRRHPFRGAAVSAVAPPEGTYDFMSFSPNLGAGVAPQLLSGLLTEVTVG